MPPGPAAVCGVSIVLFLVGFIMVGFVRLLVVGGSVAWVVMPAEERDTELRPPHPSSLGYRMLLTR